MTSSAPTIGLIGLGLMGEGFAKRLVATGYPVVGYDVVAEKVARAKGLGVASAASPAEVARARGYRADVGDDDGRSV